jgi:hypothetical protein
MADSFLLPPDGSIYTDRIFARCRDLISYQVWSGIQRPRLDAWIANFRTGEERYFAAKVLDALIYRSDDQTIALLRELLSRLIPNHARIYGLPGKLQQIYTALRDRHFDPGVRVVPVIPPGSPPTKSGPLIARHLKRSLKVFERWIVDPQYVRAHLASVDTVIFVDDFLGTGTQFSDFLRDTGLIPYLSSHCFIYGCLAGHETGINLLRGAFPSLHVAAVERLDDSHALFHDDAGSFPDEVNSAECARDFYYGLIDDRRFNITGPNRRGFGHLEVVYAFEHSVPDNSLPILWWDRSDKWRHLFDR